MHDCERDTMAVLTPRSLDEAARMLSEHPEAHLLSGGTDFMVEVNFNHRKPETVISLGAVRELGTVSDTSGGIRIGAGVTWAEIERPPLARRLPALAQAARTVGSPQIRAAGTIGGNLGTCSPAGDGLPVLAATDATVHLFSSAGERSLPFSEFMTGPKRNARRADEIISAVTVPELDGGQGYAKVGVRNAMVISIASACLAVHGNKARIALGSVGPVIIRAVEAEAWLDGLNAIPARAVTPSVAEEFGRRVAAEARPIDDHRSTAAYRTHAIGVIARRLLERSTRP